MSDDKLELSRRKILGSVGAVGAAGAAAGLGTSALFSDEETFENNSIVTGTLDMKVDWEEHYSFPQLYGFADPEDGLTTTRSDPSSLTNPVAFPPGVEADPDSDPILWVEGEDGNSDVGAYMDNTSIEAFPDTDDDGVQDFDTANPPDDICSTLTDVGLDEDGLSADDRTTNAATSDGDPLINLQDVKPGDFGEVTLSFHLCDNPGYVWLNAANVSAAENGTNEPEVNESSDSGPADETTDSPADDDEIEILDEIETAWWYDENCNNLTDGGGATGGAADVMIVADGSGSVTSNSSKFQALQDGAETLVNAVGSNVQVGLTVFADGANTVATLDDSNSDTITAIQDDGNYPGGGTDVGAGINEGQSQLTSGSGARSGVDKVLVVLTNGVSGGTPRSAATSAKNAGTDIYGIAYGVGADEDLIEDISSPPKMDDGMITDADDFAYDADEANLSDVFDDIGGRISQGEEVFYQDTLRNALQLLTSGGGIPLDGDRGDDFDETGDPTADSRGCFAATPETNCIGFSWWIPTDVGNQIQSDSVSFDLGFTTVQCRNSDGSFANAPDI